MQQLQAKSGQPTDFALVLRKAATDELWRRGDLRHLLHAGQLVLYALIMASPFSRFVLEIARRWGKTWLFCVIAIETCLKNQKGRVVYGAPTLKDLEEFIIPTIEKICEDAPDECRPVYNAKNGHWTFPNGAYIHLFGCDDKRKANRGRGPGAIAAFLDEAGFNPILRYVIRSVIRPQLMHTRGPLYIGSTPAEEPDHDFTVIAEKAEANGNYARRTIYENPLLTDEQIQGFIADDAREEGMAVDEYVKSDDFLREYMALRVINKLLIVMGEDWEKVRPETFREVERPEFFDGMTMIDWGGADPHAALFGYWHFPLSIFVIEDELLLRDGQNSFDFNAAIKAKEKALWGTNLYNGTLRAFEDPELLDAIPDWMRGDGSKAPEQPYARWGDNNLALIRDFHELHGLSIIPTAKDDKQFQVNNLRVLARSKKLWIHPRCVHADRHLRTTIWENHKRKTYKRKAGEHGDCLDCLVYGARNINMKRNPFPIGWGRSQGTLIPQRELIAQRDKANALSDAFYGGTPIGRKILKKMG